MSSPDRARLLLVDGYALIYRAFFAMINRPLRTGHGENTSAVWGVANFLERLFRNHPSEYVAWVHDAGTSFREERYPAYKATRTKLDAELQEDFDQSLERVAALLEAWRIQLVAVEGYEADDVIGTLADRAVNAGLDVFIVSGDKDFYQLINDHISLLNPGRGGPAAVSEQLVTKDHAHERLGVSPERVVDYLALVGDSSDNVPGVRGVGDKTARQLIADFGDLDTILARAREVTGKRAREALLAEADNALLSRELVTILRNVPLQIEPRELQRREPDTVALAALYAELEFHSLLSRLGPIRRETTKVSVASAVPPQTKAVRVATANDVASAVAELRRSDTVIVEALATGPNLSRGELVGLVLSAPSGEPWYFPTGHHAAGGDLLAEPPANIAALGEAPLAPVRDVLEDDAVRKVGHDLKRLILLCQAAGVTLCGAEFDTMIASFVLEPGQRAHGLDALAMDHLGSPVRTRPDAKRPGRNESPAAELPVNEIASLLGERVSAIGMLRDVLEPELAQRGAEQLFRGIELPLVEVLAEMESCGVALDTTRLAALSQRFAVELEELEQAIYGEAGTEFNINSTPQLRHVLFEKLQLPIVKKTKTGPSTDADVLAELASLGHRLPTLLLGYRELSKLRSTYVDALPMYVHPRTGRIHTSFSQTGAATGRLSSSDPNLQNIPVRTRRGEEIRRCFISSPATQLVVADYSQIELRLLAHFSHDPVFLEAFARGGDIHRETAAAIFAVSVGDVTAEMRTRAKTINFATIYGQGAFSLARQLSIPIEQAREFIDLYFARFAGVRTYLDTCVARARERGFTETLFGRRRYIPELRDRTHNVRAFGERVAMNSPLQGSAADLIKRAMIALARTLQREGGRVRLLLQVHDELVLEAPESEVSWACEVAKREMEQAAELEVPLVVEVGSGSNWYDAKP